MSETVHDLLNSPDSEDSEEWRDCVEFLDLDSGDPKSLTESVCSENSEEWKDCIDYYDSGDPESPAEPNGSKDSEELQDHTEPHNLGVPEGPAGSKDSEDFKAPGNSEDLEEFRDTKDPEDRGGSADLKNYGGSEDSEDTKDSAVPSVEGDFPIDKNVLAKFPEGTKVLSANRYGKSAWTVTARLNVKLPDGSKSRYFIKCAPDDHGHIMMEGEFNGMSELYKTMPTFVPKPHSWGRYLDRNQDTYFFLQEYLEMSDRVPDPNRFCAKLAALHRNSVSPTGKFGFHITTCQGRIPQAVFSWESSWTALFTRLLQHVVDLDFETNGYWEELDALEKRIFSDVIPRLIGNLERDGRSIKPCLIHGDLWEGNTGTSYETGDVYIFDSGAFYAHNEMEIGDWRCHYNKIHNKVYTRTYLRHYSPSEPRAEWDDRNRMYCIYYNVIYSVNHMGNGKAVRQTAFDDMYHLIDKYAPFPEGGGPSRLNESERAALSAERDHTVT